MAKQDKPTVPTKVVPRRVNEVPAGYTFKRNDELGNPVYGKGSEKKGTYVPETPLPKKPTTTTNPSVGNPIKPKPQQIRPKFNSTPPENNYDEVTMFGDKKDPTPAISPSYGSVDIQRQKVYSDKNRASYQFADPNGNFTNKAVTRHFEAKLAPGQTRIRELDPDLLKSYDKDGNYAPTFVPDSYLNSGDNVGTVSRIMKPGDDGVTKTTGDYNNFTLPGTQFTKNPGSGGSAIVKGSSGITNNIEGNSDSFINKKYDDKGIEIPQVKTGIQDVNAPKLPSKEPGKMYPTMPKFAKGGKIKGYDDGGTVDPAIDPLRSKQGVMQIGQPQYSSAGNATNAMGKQSSQVNQVGEDKGGMLNSSNISGAIAAGTTLASSLSANKQLKGEQKRKADVGAINSTVDTIGSMVPVYGQIYAGAKAASGIAKSALPTDANGNVVGKENEGINSVLTPTHELILNDISKGDTTRAIGDTLSGGTYGRVSDLLTYDDRQKQKEADKQTKLNEFRKINTQSKIQQAMANRDSGDFGKQTKDTYDIGSAKFDNAGNFQSIMPTGYKSGGLVGKIKQMCADGGAIKPTITNNQVMEIAMSNKGYDALNKYDKQRVDSMKQHMNGSGNRDMITFPKMIQSNSNKYAKGGEIPKGNYTQMPDKTNVSHKLFPKSIEEARFEGNKIAEFNSKKQAEDELAVKNAEIKEAKYQKDLKEGNVPWYMKKTSVMNNTPEEQVKMKGELAKVQNVKNNRSSQEKLDDFIENTALSVIPELPLLKFVKASKLVNFGKYITQEEAVGARSERMLSQQHKWVGQPSNLKDKFNNAVEMHNPSSDLNPSSLGRNTGLSTEVSAKANLSKANKSRIAAHEAGHYYRPLKEEGDEWNTFFDWNELKKQVPKRTVGETNKTKKYLSGKGYYKNNSSQYGDEIRERAAQLKDYIAQKNNIPANKDFKVTEMHVDDAIKNYTKDTGLDNNMTQFLSSLKDKKGFTSAMNKFALTSAPATLAANEAIQNKADGGKIEGKGTAKSDSIHAKVEEGSFVVPTENAEMAKGIRKLYLRAPVKKANINQKEGEEVKLSNGEHLFTPEENEYLESIGVNLEGLAPNADKDQDDKAYAGGTPKGGVKVGVPIDNLDKLRNKQSDLKRRDDLLNEYATLTQKAKSGNFIDKENLRRRLPSLGSEINNINKTYNVDNSVPNGKAPVSKVNPSARTNSQLRAPNINKQAPTPLEMKQAPSLSSVDNNGNVVLPSETNPTNNNLKIQDPTTGQQVKPNSKRGKGILSAIGNIDPTMAVGPMQTALGMNMLRGSTRPVDNIVLNGAYNSNVDRAQAQAGYGYSPEQMAMLNQDNQNSLTDARFSARNFAGGNSGTAFNQERQAINQGWANKLGLTSADQQLRMQKQQYADEQVSNRAQTLSANRRQMYLDALGAFQQKQQAGSELIGAGLQNAIGSYRYNKELNNENQADAERNNWTSKIGKTNP